MNPVTHFEMAGEDLERMKKFYESAFGWKMEQFGPEMGMLKETNRINGGFYKKMDDPAMNAPSVVVAVPDLGETKRKVEAAGGHALTEPMDIPGVGTYLSIRDTEGNRVGVLQPINPM